jgi:hypothetical protein
MARTRTNVTEADTADVPSRSLKVGMAASFARRMTEGGDPMCGAALVLCRALVLTGLPIAEGVQIHPYKIPTCGEIHGGGNLQLNERPYV